MQRCAELETELGELKAQYEQYFLGFERLPPTKHHDRLKKQMVQLKTAFVRQTAAKFRVGQLAQKMATYERLWERTLKEIEAGTYSRDLFKARLHSKKRDARGKKAGAEDDFHIDEDLDLSDLDADEDLERAMTAAAAAVSKPAPVVAPPAKPVSGALPVVTTHSGMFTVKPNGGAAPVVSSPSVAAVRPPSGPVPMVSSPSVAAVRPPSGPVPMVSSPSGVAARPTGGGLPKVTAPGGVPAAAAPAGAMPRVTAPGGVPAVGASARAPSTGVGLPAVRVPSGPVPAVRSPAGAPASRPVPLAEGGLSEQKIKAIYDAYVMAKKRCGEDTRSVTLDSVSATLRKQVPELMKQHQAKSVEFKVVIKDGKAVLRALPRE